MMHRNQSAHAHHFGITPNASVPRSGFRIEKSLKTTFDAGYLVPFYCDEVLPGDSFSVNATAFCRLATPIFPVMDNLHLETFFFSVPCRLVWDNWKKMMGEQDNPNDSTSYTVPYLVSTVGGFPAGSLFDYFGLPTVGVLDPAGTVQVNALPLRAYNLIWNTWFRDQNLQNSVPVQKDDGPEAYSNYALLRRGKRPDYFTTCLPWPQKGQSVALPLGTSAPVVVKAGTGYNIIRDATTHNPLVNKTLGTGASGNLHDVASPFSDVYLDPNGRLIADLSQSTSATINQLRQATQIQKLLERDARGGTRYTEKIHAHFRVRSPDARMQRPEYLGGGSTPIITTPVPQTSATVTAGQGTPLGTLSGTTTGLASGHGFTASFTEHCYVIGVLCVRADLTYQQGLRKMWSRRTQYDFYWPEFANLGEQAVLNQEIYVRGTGGGNGDDSVFGYQERWAELRYQPSEITGAFRSTHPQPLDAWHLAQRFNGLPVLNAGFIEEHPPVSRTLAIGSAADGQQVLMDCFFKINAARPLPMYSIPGLADRF